MERLVSGETKGEKREVWGGGRACEDWMTSSITDILITANEMNNMLHSCSIMRSPVWRLISSGENCVYKNITSMGVLNDESLSQCPKAGMNFNFNFSTTKIIDHL